VHHSWQARQTGARAFGELRTNLDTDDRKASLEQRSRGLAGGASDFEEAIAALE
jgi:hypothetical protein